MFIDKLIEIFHEKSMEVYGREIELVYSTMDEFIQALKDMDYSYPTYRADFLPEIENPERWGAGEDQMEYWCGYYSSFPVYK